MKAFLAAVVIFVLFAGCIGPGTTQNNTSNQSNQTGCACTMQYDPVCGTDNRTYGNACVAACARASIAHAGECVSALVCDDSDGGKDVMAKGNVVAGASSYAYIDYCSGNGSVMEYYCNNGSSSNQTISCPQGYECKEGACAVMSAAPIQSACNDSDGGEIYGTAGVVKMGGISYNDVCTDLQLVKEYFCHNGNVSNAIHMCDSGERCMDGRCILADRFCTETDSGDDIYHKGSVTWGTILASSARTDTCEDSNTLREYYCVGNEESSRTVACPSGYECRTGACRQFMCEDSDGGQDRDEWGTASAESGDYSDTCASGTAVNEYYCVGNLVQSTTLSCASGEMCSGGECVPSAPAAGCSDSDGGMDSNVFGTTSKGGSFNTDYCINSIWQTEFYCDSSDNIAWVENECPGSCDSGVCIY